MSETGGPVSTFVAALVARDLDAAAALLARDAQLAIPPLHYTRSGANDVADGLARLLGTFADLRYDLRSRYLAPMSVTDEAILGGRQTAHFLGAPPTRQALAIPARVIIDHDDVTVTRITLWPDLAALRSSVAGADRVIDLTAATRAGGMISALRATIPPRRPRIVTGTPLDDSPPVPQAPIPNAPAPPLPGPTRPVPKAPVPKQVRQRRTLMAGAVMLVTATALATWVAVGALRLPGTPPAVDAVAAASGRPAGGALADPDAEGGAARRGLATAEDATGTGSAGGSDDTPDDVMRLAPAAQLADGRDTVVINSDLLFDTDKAVLSPKAKKILRDLVVAARRQGRHGTVIVSGYTDDVGPTRYNQGLSRKRAAAVAGVLGKGLAPRMRVESHGYGESRPRVPNTSAANRAKNRRVTVQFPSEH